MKTKTKKLTYSQAKKKTWKAFSIYIRKRDCYETTGGIERGACFTCGKIYPFNELQAGHFVQGRHNAVLFDERGCHAQCYGCNVGKKGNIIVYYQKMEQIYGKDVIEDLLREDKKTAQYKVIDLVELERWFLEQTEAKYS